MDQQHNVVADVSQIHYTQQGRVEANASLSSPFPSLLKNNSEVKTSAHGAHAAYYQQHLLASPLSTGDQHLRTADSWFFRPGNHCIKTQAILDSNSQMILRLAAALAAHASEASKEEPDPTPEYAEATRAVVSRFRAHVETLVMAAGEAMTMRSDCAQTGLTELSELEQIIVALKYALRTSGNDMRLRAVLLSITEKICLSKSITRRKRELYDVLMCLLQVSSLIPFPIMT